MSQRHNPRECWCGINHGCEPVLIDYGCYECLLPHDGPVGIAECPHCGGLTGPMPAAEQPTVEARRAVEDWERDAREGTP